MLPDDARPALILWDVDYTLVAIPGVGPEVYAVAFEALFGRPIGPVADMMGRTESAIILETLALNGVADAASKVAPMCVAIADAAVRLEPRMREAGRRLPGAAEAVGAFGRPAVVQSVVTGNLRPVAEAKLAAFGLQAGIDFEVGGYGDHGTDRADLVRRARELTAAKYGRPVPADRVVVVGDTPHDIRGAHDAGVRALGVATGWTSAADLVAAGADAVLDDLADTGAAVRAVFGTLLGRA